MHLSNEARHFLEAISTALSHFATHDDPSVLKKGLSVVQISHSFVIVLTIHTVHFLVEFTPISPVLQVEVQISPSELTNSFKAQIVHFFVLIIAASPVLQISVHNFPSELTNSFF